MHEMKARWNLAEHPKAKCKKCGAELEAVGEFMLEGRGLIPAYCCENLS
jgi:hypothetical protein